MGSTGYIITDFRQAETKLDDLNLHTRGVFYKVDSQHGYYLDLRVVESASKRFVIYSVGYGLLEPANDEDPRSPLMIMLERDPQNLPIVIEYLRYACALYGRTFELPGLTPWEITVPAYDDDYGLNADDRSFLVPAYHDGVSFAQCTSLFSEMGFDTFIAGTIKNNGYMPTATALKDLIAKRHAVRNDPFKQMDWIQDYGDPSRPTALELGRYLPRNVPKMYELPVYQQSNFDGIVKALQKPLTERQQALREASSESLMSQFVQGSIKPPPQSQTYTYPQSAHYGYQPNEQKPDEESQVGKSVIVEHSTPASRAKTQEEALQKGFVQRTLEATRNAAKSVGESIARIPSTIINTMADSADSGLNQHVRLDENPVQEEEDDDEPMHIIINRPAPSLVPSAIEPMDATPIGQQIITQRVLANRDTTTPQGEHLPYKSLPLTREDWDAAARYGAVQEEQKQLAVQAVSRDIYAPPPTSSAYAALHANEPNAPHPGFQPSKRYLKLKGQANQIIDIIKNSEIKRYTTPEQMDQLLSMKDRLENVFAYKNDPKHLDMIEEMLKLDRSFVQRLLKYQIPA